jgi:hypothetical protein
MSSYRIGTVERVDFTPINKQPGFGENVDDVVMSAFVHFSDPILGYDNCYNYRSDSYLGINDFWDTISSNQPYKLQIARNEYWICLKNKSPVRYTMMNIHQVVENGRYLENLVQEQNDEIKNLREIIEEQQKTIEGIQGVVYQVIGGIYSQSTQSGTIDSHLNIMGISSDTSDNTSKWGNWPTTRQGDECEKRITALEDYMRVTTRFDRFEYPRELGVSPLFDCEEQDNYLLMRKHENNYMDCDNHSISTHSSMPDLVDDDSSVSTHSSMPDLMDIISVDSQESCERIRNSYELCGNN